MLSYLLPVKISVSVAPGFIKLKGPKGSFIKKIGALKFYLIATPQGRRLFIQGTSIQEETTILAYIMRLSIGLSRGYRKRLRLVGIGFRATIRDIEPEVLQLKNFRSISGNNFLMKNYIQKRRFKSYNSINKDLKTFAKVNKVKALLLKIGFSHELAYPQLNTMTTTEKVSDVQVSRLEGRTKGGLICISGLDPVNVNQRASEIRSFRFPDAYKGKGLHYDREVLILKKGKRQG